MLLILTSSGDATATYLESKLPEADVPYVRLDTDTCTDAVTVGYAPDRPTIRFVDRHLTPSDVSHVWFRRPRPITVQINGDAAERAHVANEWGEAIEGFLAHVPRQRWMNHPTANVQASHKLEQLTRARAYGLCVPDTLVTQSREEVVRFFDAHDGRIVAKPLASGYLERMAGGSASIFTSRVLRSHLSGASIASCPTLFQQEIAKTYDVRVTIVDDRMTAVTLRREIEGQQIVDIRRDNMENVRYAVCEIPDHIRTNLRALITSYDLRFAAVDFAVTPDDTWFFFEINPNGQWAWTDLAGATAIWQDFAHAFSA